MSNPSPTTPIGPGAHALLAFIREALATTDPPQRADRAYIIMRGLNSLLSADQPLDVSPVMDGSCSLLASVLRQALGLES